MVKILVVCVSGLDSAVDHSHVEGTNVNYSLPAIHDKAKLPHNQPLGF